MKRLLFFILTILPMFAMAEAVEINGINYNLVTKDEANIAEVISRPEKYSGSIVIPETVIYNEKLYYVTRIGDKAFSDCTDLISVSIGNSVEKIGSRAFFGCSGLSSLYIPMSVENINETAFEECTGITSIIVDPNNSVYNSRDNCNAIIRGNQLVLACDNTALPLNVTAFTWYAFRNCNTVELPDGLETMPTLMFYNCNHLKVLKIPHSVRTIEFSAIGGCNNLKNIIFEDGNEELKFQNTYMDEPYWILATSLDSVYMGRRISYEFTKSKNSQTYKQYSPFRNNESLRVVKFGSNISSIQEYYFYGCTNLTNVYLPDNLEAIGISAFGGCSKLQSIDFNSKLDSIGFNAFNGCNSLKKIVIPSNVRTIGENAFANTKMSELIIEEGENNLSSSGDCICSGSSIDSVFWGRNGVSIEFKKIKHLVLGNISYFWSIGTSKSPYSDYKGCDTINVLSIKAASDTLHFAVAQTVNFSSYRYNYTLPFHNIHIDSVYCDRIIDVHDSYNTGRTFNPFAGVNSSFKLTIGNSITSISNNMFAGCNIPSVFIPKNIKKISSTSFNNCLTLSGLVIEDSSEPLDFGEGNNFYGCQLGDVYIGRNMRFSTNSPFNRNKEGIQKLTFGNNVTEIPSDAFSGLKNLKELTLPQNLKTIGSMAFYGCNGLTELIVPASVTEIGRQAFDLCNHLKTLRLDDGKELLKFTAEPNYLNNAFQNSPLEEVYIGRDFSFNNSSPLAIFETMKSLTFGEEVLSIQARSFIGCPNLKDVTSYSKVVPTTNDIVFTSSYQTNATLHVPYALYDEYKVANVWKDFGKIVNFEGLYNLVYSVDGEEYKKYVVEQGTSITPEAEPTKEGYIFSGWSEIPTTMPAEDVTITGSFSINKYKISLYLDNLFYKTVEYDYNSIIALEDAPKKEGYTFDGWKNVPATMPASDISIYGTYTKTTAVYNVIDNSNGASAVKILSPDGKELASPQQGLNIIKYSDGTMKKIMVK